MKQGHLELIVDNCLRRGPSGRDKCKGTTDYHSVSVTLSQSEASERQDLVTLANDNSGGI